MLLQGYALTGHCLVLLLTAVLDHMGSPGMFYLMWVIFGGLTSLKMVRASHTAGPAHITSHSMAITLLAGRCACSGLGCLGLPCYQWLLCGTAHPTTQCTIDCTPLHAQLCRLLRGHAASAGGCLCVALMESPARPCPVSGGGSSAPWLPALPQVCLPPDLRGPGQGRHTLTVNTHSMNF